MEHNNDNLKYLWRMAKPFGKATLVSVVMSAFAASFTPSPFLNLRTFALFCALEGTSLLAFSIDFGCQLSWRDKWLGKYGTTPTLLPPLLWGGLLFLAAAAVVNYFHYYVR